MRRKISKTLSPNDLGLTGSHQVGFLVPKEKEFLEFFPKLDGNSMNPQTVISFEDPAGSKWQLKYVYYNNRKFGGTRNEYRLTRVTGFLKASGLQPGDDIVFERDGDRYHIKGQRAAGRVSAKIIRPSGSWKVLDI